MPSSADLWGYVRPITTWITLAEPESEEHTERCVTLRVRRGLEKSVTATCRVDIYSSESQILRACAEVLKQLEQDQEVLTHTRVLRTLDQEIGNWVDPF